MNIIDFYKKLSLLLEEARERKISQKTASNLLNDLLIEAKNNKLDVDVSEDILSMDNLSKLDDERSFAEEEYSYENSYDQDED